MRREGSPRNHSCDWEGGAQISIFGFVLDSLSVLIKNVLLFAFISSSKMTTCTSSRKGDIHNCSTNMFLSMRSLTWCDTSDFTVRPGHRLERVK